MSIINITVKNKIAQNPTKEIVCGNSGYVVYFDFDEEWTEHTLKTARFSFNSEFIDVLFEGNKVKVPIITNAITCAVGVYAGDLQTTTPAIIKCQKSILCDGGSPADPLPDVYNQIIELCNETVETARSVEERADNGEFKGDKGEDGKDYVLTESDKKEIANMAKPIIDQHYAPESANAQSGTAVAEAVSKIKTTDGTVVSQNADFAEIAEWWDGNPDNEDRIGYFVCANVPVDGIVMKKATSIDDVKGVSILAPAFAGNYTKDKLDSNGNLLPKYSYVAIIGFVPVIDNGTCIVGGRCMPDDNGCAIPSSNSMGYQVVNRIDENRVLIIIEPNGDMVQRIKTRVNELQEDIDNLAPDQTYNPESENAQSGIAVAEAIASVPQSTMDYEIIGDITLTEAASDIVFRDNINKYNNFLLLFEGTVSEAGQLRFATGFNYGAGSFMVHSFHFSNADATTQYTWYNKVDYIKTIENSDGTTNRIYITAYPVANNSFMSYRSKQAKSLPTSFFVRAMNGKPYAAGSRVILLGRGAI